MGLGLPPAVAWSDPDAARGTVLKEPLYRIGIGLGLGLGLG